MLFSEILAAGKQDAAGLRIAVPDNWKQGRTVYGGLTGGICLHAARELTGESRKLRSALISFVGPSTGEVHASAETLRSGRTAASIRASVSSNGAPATEALLTFSDSRESAVSYAPEPAPRVAAPSDENVFDLASAGGPSFVRNFDLVPAGGNRPMSGADKPDVLWWARHRDPLMRESDIGLVCLGDVLPPAALAMVSTPVNVSSMTWMIDIVADDLASDNGWFLFQSRAEAVGGGFSTQDMSVWNSNGNLVAKGRQTVTMFG